MSEPFPKLYRLADAVRVFFPDGGITARSLRTEARAGRLDIIRIANKDFVTAEAIQAMLERCTRGAGDFSSRSDTSANAPAGTSRGLSIAERERLARASINETLERMKKR